MKKVKIGAYESGLVFAKDGGYSKMIGSGTYRFWKGERVIVYSRLSPFTPPVALDVLLQHDAFTAAVHVVEVKDEQIAIHYENGLLKEVLTAGRYVFWKSLVRHHFVLADISKVAITEPIDKAVLQHRLLAPYVRSVSVESYEMAVLFVDGKFQNVLESGVYYFWKNAIAVYIARVDMRVQVMEVNGQEILTRDKASLRINAQAQFQVVSPEKAILDHKNYDAQLYSAFQLALREYVAAFSFDELLDKKDAVSVMVLEKVAQLSEAIGVSVKSFGIRDIILPGDMKDIMNQVLIAEKKAQANSIMRREETASTRSLLNTAKLMEDNPMLWKLKEMEYVEKIAEKISHITVAGNGQLVEQLKDIFIAGKEK